MTTKTKPADLNFLSVRHYVTAVFTIVSGNQALLVQDSLDRFIK
jgi:hypothetical protein